MAARHGLRGYSVPLRRAASNQVVTEKRSPRQKAGTGISHSPQPPADVTGASSGIGAATARALVPLGCEVVLVARFKPKLDALAGELGSEALALPTDVTVDTDVRTMVTRSMQRVSRIDVLSANAGVYIPGRVAEGDPDA